MVGIAVPIMIIINMVIIIAVIIVAKCSMYNGRGGLQGTVKLGSLARGGGGEQSSCPSLGVLVLVLGTHTQKPFSSGFSYTFMHSHACSHA